MAIELYRLIEKVQHMDITLLAGEEGLHNPVSWVHMVETPETSDFLDGGEIAFMTGLGISGADSMMTLVEHIYGRNAAGIIVNIGPFIESVPNEVCDYCNAHSLPLFIVPWKIHLAEIMRIFCFTITKEDQKDLEISSAFKNAIFFPKQEELYAVSLSRHNFHVNWKYSVCVIRLRHPKGGFHARMEALTTGLNNYMQHHYHHFAIFSYDKEILAVTANYTEENLHEFVHTLEKQAGLLLAKSEEICIGVGKLTQSIRCLYKSYAQAKAIQRLQSNGKISKSLIFYSDMGIYKLLMGIEDWEILTEYYDKTIRPLIEYDEKNHSDLATVLHCYLNHNGSVKDTADELFVHRNTINYKINKIEELLDIDLSSLDIRLQMSIGFMLQDML